MPVFGRFDYRAQSVMNIARQAAIRFRHSFIGSEHLLLALLSVSKGIVPVIILMASVTTGITINRGWECIEFYGGKLAGISSIFSAISEYGHMPVNSLFTTSDIPNYHTYKKSECPYCKDGQRIEALVNGYGYSELK